MLDQTGLIYLRARYYDPSVSRFIQIDNNYDGEQKSVSSQNRYVYTLNNPYKYVDKNGNWSLFKAVGDFVNNVVKEVKKVVKKVVNNVRNWVDSTVKNFGKVAGGAANTIRNLFDGNDNNYTSAEGGGYKKNKPSSKNANPQVKCPEVYSSIEGYYGGDQGGPLRMWLNGTTQERGFLKSIIKGYKEYKKMKDYEITSFLETLNEEGCTYAASANTIFVNYVGKEKNFKGKFGFDMYRKKGNGKVCNFEYLITDLYCASDNHNKGFWPWQGDEYNKDEGDNGASLDGQTYRLELYASLKKFEVEVTASEGWFIFASNIVATTENYEKYKKKGQLAIALDKFKLYYSVNGDYYSSDGAHSMTVTGSEGGSWISVSSWGEKYYVNLSEYNTSSAAFSVFVYK